MIAMLAVWISAHQGLDWSTRCKLTYVTEVVSSRTEAALEKGCCHANGRVASGPGKVFDVAFKL